MEQNRNSAKEDSPPIHLPQTYESFHKYLEFIKRKEDQDNRFDEIFREITYDGYGSIYFEYQTALINLLSEIWLCTDDEYDISYFVYDTDWGKKADEYYITITDDKTGVEVEIKFRDDKDLYAYLAEEYPKRYEAKYGGNSDVDSK